MKSATLLLAGALLITATSCSKSRLRGEGSVISDTRSLSNFTRVEANGSTNITVVKDSAYKVIVTGYQNLVPAFETKVNGNKLTLEFDDQYISVRNNNVTVEVHTPNIEYYNVNGSGNTTIGSGFDGSSFEGHINGSGELTVNNSKFTTLKAYVNGSGDIKAASTTCENGRAEISGSGNIDMTVTKHLSVKISGSGNVSYWGNPTTDVDVSGSGNVKKKG
ncbi:MAG: hypothetical protein EOP56_05920 [Sphingobacteriales bacterium]|nr:MAG: hypothetical protein EOP56_05920 [Sphingobacteriales bacterium]